MGMPKLRPSQSKRTYYAIIAIVVVCSFFVSGIVLAMEQRLRALAYAESRRSGIQIAAAPTALRNLADHLSSGTEINTKNVQQVYDWLSMVQDPRVAGIQLQAALMASGGQTRHKKPVYGTQRRYIGLMNRQALAEYFSKNRTRLGDLLAEIEKGAPSRIGALAVQPGRPVGHLSEMIRGGLLRGISSGI